MGKKPLVQKESKMRISLKKENRAGDKETEVSPEISPVILVPAAETTTLKLLTRRPPPPFP